MSTADSVPTPDSSASADPPTAVPLTPLPTPPVSRVVVGPGAAGAAASDDRRDRDMLTGVWRREEVADAEGRGGIDDEVPEVGFDTRVVVGEKGCEETRLMLFLLVTSRTPNEFLG